jgi:hypothetical protein
VGRPGTGSGPNTARGPLPALASAPPLPLAPHPHPGGNPHGPLTCRRSGLRLLPVPQPPLARPSATLTASPGSTATTAHAPNRPTATGARLHLLHHARHHVDESRPARCSQCAEDRHPKRATRHVPAHLATHLLNRPDRAELSPRTSRRLATTPTPLRADWVRVPWMSCRYRPAI